MRFLRALFHHLLNNERIINKLAESKPIRRSAQFVAHILIRTGMINGTRRTFSSPKDFIEQLKAIADNLKKELQDAKKKPPQ